tara:strand:+ start:149 stop:391 length:243 start_codon:yes stop_codon:yes gene_type:complete
MFVIEAIREGLFTIWAVAVVALIIGGTGALIVLIPEFVKAVYKKITKRELGRIELEEGPFFLYFFIFFWIFFIVLAFVDS